MAKRRWKVLPEELRHEVIRLAATGAKRDEICTELRLGKGSVARVLAPLGGVIRPTDWLVAEGALSLDDRVEILIGMERGDSFEAIGTKVGRHRSSVWREVRANGGRKKYAPMKAHRRACEAARRPKDTKLSTNPVLLAAVVDGLEKLWSPKQIAGKLRDVFPDQPEMHVSHETIYKTLFVQGRGELRRELAACLRTGRAVRKRRGREEHRGRIVGMVNISERPAEVEDRAVPGHWEGDLIIGKNGASAIGTLVERSTRFVILLHLPDGRTADKVREAMAEAIAGLPALLCRSITWDQGKEMAEHAQFSVDTGIDVYFCDPHSPWQRGSNENTNGLLRQYFPKGTDLSVHSAADLQAAADSLNTRPRETLNWKTPLERLTDLVAPAA